MEQVNCYQHWELRNQMMANVHYLEFEGENGIGRARTDPSSGKDHSFITRKKKYVDGSFVLDVWQVDSGVLKPDCINFVKKWDLAHNPIRCDQHVNLGNTTLEQLVENDIKYVNSFRNKDGDLINMAFVRFNHEDRLVLERQKMDYSGEKNCDIFFLKTPAPLENCKFFADNLDKVKVFAVENGKSAVVSSGRRGR